MRGGRVRFKYKILSLILPSVGLFLIGHSILFFNDKTFHPSFYTLSPIIGVCLVIWFSQRDELITKILSTKLFVGMGLISYSLYLWHYPIFAFDKIIEFTQGSLFKKLLLVTIIVILSILSYYFVERPARNKNNKSKVVLSLILISISILVFFNFNIIQKNGYKSRLPEILTKNIKEDTRYLLVDKEGKVCHNNECKFNTSLGKNFYIIGDSHMASIMFDLKKRIDEKNYQLITSTADGCLFFPGFNEIDFKTQIASEKCNDSYFQKLKKTLSNDKNSIIIFGGRFPVYLSGYYFDNKELGIEGGQYEKKYVSVGKYYTIEDSFKNELSEISKNHKIILIYPIPEVGWSIPNKLNILFKTLPNNINKKIIKASDYITTSFEVYKNRTLSSFELLDSIKGENIYRVYPHKLFCDTAIKNRCVAHDDKNIFYFDDDHPSVKSAEMINDLIMKEIEKIELKSN